MIDVKSLFYDKFLQFVVDRFSPAIKQAEGGHCLKLTGLALAQLQSLIAPLRKAAPGGDIFIVSDELSGPDVIGASKLIELRNDASRPLVALIPANSRTAAEDSYGDATFKVLDATSLQQPFFVKLKSNVPTRYSVRWKTIEEAIDASLRCPTADVISYLLFVEANGYADEAWGDGLFLLGMLPDSRLALGSIETLIRRFLVNLRQCTEVVCDFSCTSAERVAALHVPDDSLRRKVMKYLDGLGVSDRMELCADVFHNHPELNLANWSIGMDSVAQPVIVNAEFVPGADKDKELIRDSNGDILLLFPKNSGSVGGKPVKRRITLNVSTDPSPKDEPSIAFYEVLLVKFVDFEEIGSIKKVAVGARRSPQKKFSVNIDYDEGIDEGEYLLKVRVLDNKKLPLEIKPTFKESNIQDDWIRFQEENPSAEIEAFRLEHKVLYSNETQIFSIQIDDDDALSVDFGKRAKVNSLFHAQADFSVSAISAEAKPDDPIARPAPDTQWTVGNLVSTFQFDFGNACAYQLSLSNKLMLLEREFYRHSNSGGRVVAELGANSIETGFKNIEFQPCLSSCKFPKALASLRSELFKLIVDSAPEGAGLVSTFDFFENADLVKRYIASYSKWLSAMAGEGPDAESSACMQNLDTVELRVELPDGSSVPVRLISPLHPLRLAWFCAGGELLIDWRAAVLRSYDAYADGKAWRRDFCEFFRSGLSSDVAPIALADGSLNHPFQYIGELTFGWGVYAVAPSVGCRGGALEARQLKAYVRRLLNVSKDKGVDDDLDPEAISSRIVKYLDAHPYATKLVVNIFNAGDASAFAAALLLVQHTRYAGRISFEVRLFADSSLLKPGAALQELINPESQVAEIAEQFSQSPGNRLFPKLRYSVNSFDDFIKDPSHFQAHITFLVSPFRTDVKLQRPEPTERSFFLNGLVMRSVLAFEKNDSAYRWSRFFAIRGDSRASSPLGLSSERIFLSIQSLVASQLSATPSGGAPATCLVLQDCDKMFLDFVHDVSDWVVTFDKNMGPEFFDFSQDEMSAFPYMLDYAPCRRPLNVSAYLSVKPSSEVDGVLSRCLDALGADCSADVRPHDLLDDVRAASGSFIFNANAEPDGWRRVLSVILSGRLMRKSESLSEAFLVPLSLHHDLFESASIAADALADFMLVRVNPVSKVLELTTLCVECVGLSADDDVFVATGSICSRSALTEAALRKLYQCKAKSADRYDRALRDIELRELLLFYLARALRYGLVAPSVARAYRMIIDEQFDGGFSINIKQTGLLFNLKGERGGLISRQDGVTIFPFGRDVISRLFSSASSLDEEVRLPDEFVDEFGPSVRAAVEEFLKKACDSQDVTPGGAERGAKPVAKRTARPVAQKKSAEKSAEHAAVSSAKVDIRPSIIEPAPAARPAVSSPEPRPASAQTQNQTQIQTQTQPQPQPQAQFVIAGADSDSTRSVVIGKMFADGRTVSADLGQGNIFSIFGAQGSGVGYSAGAIVEAALCGPSRVNSLSSPLAGVVFHFSDDLEVGPRFASMARPNDVPSQLSRLKAEYGAEPASLTDVLLLTPSDMVDDRQAEYPDVDVKPLALGSKEMSVNDWMLILGAKDGNADMAKEVKLVLKKCRGNISLGAISDCIEASSMPDDVKDISLQRLADFEAYISDSDAVGGLLKPGRLIIVDLRDEFMDEDEAMCLFLSMMDVFAAVKDDDGSPLGKLMVFDEAHKLLRKDGIVGAAASAFGDVRRKGVSVVLASHDPAAMPLPLVELSSVVMLHRFSSPAWIAHLQKAITALHALSPADMDALATGEAFVWASRSSDVALSSRPAKVTVRPRLSKHV